MTSPSASKQSAKGRVAYAGGVFTGPPSDFFIAHATEPADLPRMSVGKPMLIGTGGLLCHSAIVAREFGIPCIMALGGTVDNIAFARSIRADFKTGKVTWE